MTSSTRKEVVAVVPARAGSKGVKDKNIRPLQGHPLIAYSIQAGLKAQGISRVIVSTDSPEYAEIAKEYGAEVPFLRPAAISGDQATDIDFFNHLIEWMTQHDGYVPGYFVHLRPTTPLRDPCLIDKAIDIFVDSDHTSLRSAHPMSESAYKSFEKLEDRWARIGGVETDMDKSNFGRQQYPITYEANGYVDIVRPQLIKEQHKLHGDHVYPFITPRAYEIDEEIDLELITYFAERNASLINSLFA